MPTVHTFLWFDDQALAAVRFYAGALPNVHIIDDPGEDEPVFSVKFTIGDQSFTAFNGGSHYQFTPAISLFVSVATQAEVDDLWDKLSAGGEPGRCGWLKDKFGLSWQIIPDGLGDLLQSDDEEASSRAMEAMLGMNKIDLAAMQAAFDKA